MLNVVINTSMMEFVLKQAFVGHSVESRTKVQYNHITLASVIQYLGEIVYETNELSVT